MELNENGNKTYQILRDTGKEVLRGKYITLNAYVRKEGKSQINILLSSHLKKEEQIKLKATRRKEIIKIRAKIMRLKTEKQ